MTSQAPLDLELPPDSPIFRAHLSSIESRSSTLLRTLKLAQSQINAVLDLSYSLESAEQELFSCLEGLNESGDLVRDFARWKADQRRAEREGLDEVLGVRLKAMRGELKVKGIGNGLALSNFEELSKSYYSSLSRFLSPRSSTTHNNPSSSAETLSSAAQSLSTKSFDLKRFNTQSMFLWSSPPYSIGYLEVETCLAVWMAGLLPDAPAVGGLAEQDFDTTPQTPTQRVERHSGNTQEATQWNPKQQTKEVRHKRSRTLSLKPSTGELKPLSSSWNVIPPTPAQSGLTFPSSPVQNSGSLKSRVRDRLTVLAKRKEALELAWAERERIAIDMKKEVESEQESVRVLEERLGVNLVSGREKEGRRKSFGLNHHHHHKEIHAIRQEQIRAEVMTIGQSTVPMKHVDPIESERSSTLGVLEGKKKHRGMGSKIRNMISSASIHSNLSSKANNPSASSGTHPRMSLQIPSRPSSALEKERKPRPDLQNRRSLQTPRSTSPDERLSASGSGTPMVREPSESTGLGSPATIDEGSIFPSAMLSQTGSSTPLTHSFPVGVNERNDNEGRRFPTFRDLQDHSGVEMMEEETKREQAGRRREGLVWTPGVWEDVGTSSGRSGSERKEKVKWDSCWMVLSSCKIYEYRGGLSTKLGTSSQTIDLRFATAREGRDTDRRFTFEIVTPTQGKRMYQATSTEEMKSWIYAISNAVESVLNGTSSYRNVNRVGTDDVDDHASPLTPTGAPIGLGFPSMPELEQGSGRNANVGIGWPKPARKTSLKEALRQNRPSLGFGQPKTRPKSSGTVEELYQPRTVKHSLSSLSVPTQQAPPLLTSRSRHSSRSSDGRSVFEATDEGSTGVHSATGRSLPTSLLQSRKSSSYKLDLEESMKQAILVANSDQPDSSFRSNSNQGESERGRTRSAGNIHGSKSFPHFVEQDSNYQVNKADMALLRKVADQPGNQNCADCARSLKGEYAQRWATVALHNRPIVMFICQRCAGIHRGLGSHMSKIRSPDLDKWTEEMIITARSSGNMRGNAIWEKRRNEHVPLHDLSLTSLKAHIEKKYVEGMWLDERDRAYYFDDEPGIAL